LQRWLFSTAGRATNRNKTDLAMGSFIKPIQWRLAMLTPKLTLGCFLLMPLLTIPCLAQAQAKIDDATVAVLTNPELHDESNVVETIKQHLSLLKDIESLSEKDDYDQSLRASSLFFLRFHLDSSDRTEYVTIGKKLYVRMPRYETQFKNFLLSSMERLYDNVSLRWKELGFPIPEGFVYIWVVSDIEEMEREFGKKENARAFTLPCRYIVVPYSAIAYDLYRNMEKEALSKGANPASFQERMNNFLEQDFNHSFAHELTHAFVASTLGLKGSNEIEKWFQEGIAIWMSQDNGALLTSEYKSYKSLFDYIRMKYGNARFRTFLQKTITAESANEGLQQGLSISSLVQLKQEAASWQTLIKWMKAAIGVVILGFFGWFFSRLIMGKSQGVGVLIFITLVSIYAWGLGYTNLATDSVEHAAMLNNIALLPVMFTLLEIARYRYFSRNGSALLFEVEALIKKAVESQANLYSHAQFNSGKALFAEAQLYMQKAKPQRAVYCLQKARQALERSMVQVSASKKRKEKEVTEAYNDVEKQMRDLVETVEQMPSIEAFSIDGYDHGDLIELMRMIMNNSPGRAEFREQMRARLNDLSVELMNSKEMIEAGKLVAAEKAIESIRGKISELRASVKVHENRF
jgi:hypothetical protein